MSETKQEETLDLLIGDWWIWQLKRGHRFSSDDFVTAWVAASAMPGAKNLLDLGSGIGSVGLMTLWNMAPESCLRGVEVQELSYGLACRTVEHNGLGARVELVRGDIRDRQVVADTHSHDLVTGSPPYFPLGTGVVSPHPQRAAARMELHGSVFDYCEAAARSLCEHGRFVFCHSATDPRPREAIDAVGLKLISQQDVVFGKAQAAMITVFECGWQGQEYSREPLLIRDSEGRWTDAYQKVRFGMGIRDPSRASCGLRRAS
ncbi:MAG: SAM-dependent methyltransferase [Myxococcota bacterium]|nr:SAM-dependent methyltransferase [Myxococcota bacterium]